MTRFFTFVKGLFPKMAGGRALGVAREKRRYDLPLSSSPSNRFLRLLFALMTLLGILSLCVYFALDAMGTRWTSGLEGKISIEIPATDSGGAIIDPALVRTMTMNAAHILKTTQGIVRVDAQSDETVQKMLSPWLGEDLTLEGIPLPGLIAVEIDPQSPPNLEKLSLALKDVAPRARIDTHEEWLSDVLRFTGALQLSSLLIALVIGGVTLVSVAGGVQSKLSEHKEELELLHLMGASDSYIAKQIRRHTLLLCLQGGGVGILLGAGVLVLLKLYAGDAGLTLLPDFEFTSLQKVFLVMMPLPLALLAVVTAQFTVLRVLTKMP